MSERCEKCGFGNPPNHWQEQCTARQRDQFEMALFCSEQARVKAEADNAGLLDVLKDSTGCLDGLRHGPILLRAAEAVLTEHPGDSLLAENAALKEMLRRMVKAANVLRDDIRGLSESDKESLITMPLDMALTTLRLVTTEAEVALAEKRKP